MMVSVEEWRRLLALPALLVDFGADLLDAEDRPIEDLSPDLLAVSVRHDLYADVHRSVDLELTRDLAWGVDRVRPWLAVAEHEAGPWYRRTLGVFLPTTPEEAAGEEPRTRRVTGMDKLWLLQREVGDTYVVPAGASYLDVIRGVLDDAGVAGRLLMDGDRQTTVLEEAGVWPLLEDGYTWLDVINGLLGMIAYRGLWVDEDGRFRSEPVRPAAERGSTWTFDTTDVLEGVVGEDRILSADVWGLPNVWRFVRRKDAVLDPDDVYTVDHAGGLPVEQRRPRTALLDVADRAALVAEGDRIVAEDTATERVASFPLTGPVPLGHGDVVTVRDPDLGLSARAVVRRWSVDQDGQADVECELI